jgi:transposase
MVLLMLFPHDPLIILLDNASWHWGEEVQKLLSQNPRLHLLYLPTACPDLNPQEQVWMAARVNVSHNYLYIPIWRA